MSFLSLYQQEFPPLQIDESTLNTIREFFKRLEAHDQRVFTTRSKDGIAVPVTHEDHRALYANLAQVTHEYMREVFIDPRSKP